MSQPTTTLRGDLTLKTIKRGHRQCNTVGDIKIELWKVEQRFHIRCTNVLTGKQVSRTSASTLNNARPIYHRRLAELIRKQRGTW